MREVLLFQAGIKFGPDLPTDLADDLAERLTRLDATQLTALVASIAISPTLAEWLASFPE